MSSTATRVPHQVHASTRPGAGVTATALLVALCCIGFAAFNVAFEATDHFADGTHTEYTADYRAGFAVMNWLVVVLKLIGAGLAVLSVSRRPRFVRPSAVGVLLWAAFATLGVYVLGSLVQAAGMVSGIAGSRDQIDLAGVVYVGFFLLFAAGFGVLAASYSRRHHLRRRHTVLGVIGGPMVLGLVLFAAPTVLAGFGLLPTA
jgi:hypothetical protein